ncbi:MAG: hypothetical protein ACTS73_09560 [Arsenophonus sp. NEOnobi-MAG3]
MLRQDTNAAFLSLRMVLIVRVINKSPVYITVRLRYFLMLGEAVFHLKIGRCLEAGSKIDKIQPLGSSKLF